MKRGLQIVAAALAAIVVVASVASVVRSQTGDSEGGPPPTPAPREIPGINAPDPHPNGCVDCHVKMTEPPMDVRISTLMGQWMEGVEPKLLAAAKAAASDPATITGKHPKVGVTNVPKACLICHGASSTKAPPFARLMHVVHLTGEGNMYMAHFQGDCTHCHKLDQATGTWSIPSAKEPAAE